MLELTKETLCEILKYREEMEASLAEDERLAMKGTAGLTELAEAMSYPKVSGALEIMRSRGCRTLKDLSDVYESVENRSRMMKVELKKRLSVISQKRERIDVTFRILSDQPEPYKTIVRRFYCDGEKMEAIAMSLRKSVKQIRNMRRTCEDEIISRYNKECGCEECRTDECGNDEYGIGKYENEERGIQRIENEGRGIKEHGLNEHTHKIAMCTKTACDF